MEQHVTASADIELLRISPQSDYRISQTSSVATKDSRIGADKNGHLDPTRDRESNLDMEGLRCSHLGCQPTDMRTAKSGAYNVQKTTYIQQPQPSKYLQVTRSLQNQKHLWYCQQGKMGDSATAIGDPYGFSSTRTSRSCTPEQSVGSSNNDESHPRQVTKSMEEQKHLVYCQEGAMLDNATAISDSWGFSSVRASRSCTPEKSLGSSDSK
ncbi:hypothetical protein EJ08DRAFT_739683 [Tothia fuscella]|uniref:Uncharacterized protein n=1 Tax=Tothia fuscella TaxID=1048955 RepID=A0A9P4TRB1_9PEZI|nr:hypothetical protein EJ08DRAFT_739683 [Tothia fuscella]